MGILVIGTNGTVSGVDTASGDEAWRTRLHSGGLLNMASGDVTVLVDADVVVAGCNGHLFGLDLHRGDILWHNPLRGLGNGVVAMAAAGTSVQYIHRHTRSETST